MKAVCLVACPNIYCQYNNFVPITVVGHELCFNVLTKYIINELIFVNIARPNGINQVV